MQDSNLIRLQLNSEAQKDHFMSHIRRELIRYIREKTGAGNLEILAVVSPRKENGNKIYTDQDKLEFLISKNPELGELKTRFNLDFDQ